MAEQGGTGRSSAAAARAAARREQAVARQITLLHAARDVFSEQGFKAASVRQITQRADTAHGTFYLYFTNKEDAFVQVLSEASERMLVEASAPWTRNPRESAARATAGFLDVFVQHPGLWRALLEAILLSESIEQRWAEMRGVFAERVARSLRREQRAGVVRPFDPDEAAYALVSMVEWHAFTHFVMRTPVGPVDKDSVAHTVDLLTDLWLHAVYGDGLDLDLGAHVEHGANR